MSTIDEVKQKLDIVEVIGQYVKLTKDVILRQLARFIMKKLLLSMFSRKGNHGTVSAPAAPAAMFLLL
jgi:hypothetical protein